MGFPTFILNKGFGRSVFQKFSGCLKRIPGKGAGIYQKTIPRPMADYFLIHTQKCLDKPLQKGFNGLLSNPLNGAALWQ
jgi:hypothetical protein